MRPTSPIRSLLLCTLLAGSALGADSAAKAARERTPAQRAIDRATAALESRPDDARHHSALALALARRARETADPAYYDEARAALERALSLAPDSFEARKVLTWTLLGQHEFALARVHAQELRRLVPDDPSVYGFLSDAQVELGNVAQAEEAVRWMLKLRPGNVPGMTRAAHLRELFGDVEGALELMLGAYHSIDPAEVEDRAWTLTHAAHLELSRGEIARAELMAEQALVLFPDYHYALAQLAEVRRAQGRLEEASSLLERRAHLAPHPENLAELAWALESQGEVERARELLANFEEHALEESTGPDNANRELVAHYVKTDRPQQALALARTEIARKQDVHTRDLYAWALFHCGALGEARFQIEAALEVGIRDAVLFYHAGAIAQAQGDFEAAASYLARSLEQNPHSRVAHDVRQLLADTRRE